MSMFGSAPNTEVPKAAKSSWMFSMNNLMDMVNQLKSGAWKQRQLSQYSDTQNTIANQNNESQNLATRGITDSGVNFGNIRARDNIANFASGLDDKQMALLQQMLSGMNSQSMSGIQGGSFGGDQGWMGGLLSAGAGLYGDWMTSHPKKPS